MEFVIFSVGVLLGIVIGKVHQENTGVQKAKADRWQVMYGELSSRNAILRQEIEELKTKERE